MLRSDTAMDENLERGIREALAKAAGLGHGRKRVSRKPHKKAVLQKAA